MHMCTFDLEHLRVILGSFSTLSTKLVCNSKTADCRAKQKKLGPVGLSIICMDQFDFEHVMVIQ